MFLAQIPITEIVPPRHAVRAVMDEGALRELAESIERAGLIEPIVVERTETGFEVIAGHRRLLACQLAKLAAIPCMVREEKDTPATALKVRENLYREDLSPVEEAGFYAELYADLGEDVDKVCDVVHQNRTYVEGRLNLLHGDRSVLEALAEKKIGIGVAEELNKFKLEVDRRYYLEWAVRQGATVGTVRDWRRANEAHVAAMDGGSVIAAEIHSAAMPASGPMPCLFCGSPDDQHMMVFKMAHSYCLRQAEERRQENETTV